MDKESQKNLFAAAQLTHTPVDFVYLRKGTSLEELKRYEVLFYPHAVILTEERVKLLEDYVASGGKLVMEMCIRDSFSAPQECFTILVISASAVMIRFLKRLI